MKKEPLAVDRLYSPHREAMLAALRVVLDLPCKPVMLRDDQLALSSHKSDVYNLTARTQQEGGQEE
jgi:hypothetical protein